GSTGLVENGGSQHRSARQSIVDFIDNDNNGNNARQLYANGISTGTATLIAEENENGQHYWFGYYREGVTSPAQITADQNDYVPATGDAVGTWRLTSDAARAITGIANGVIGRRLTIVNVGANTITLKNQSASSVAANRLITGTGADLAIAADQSVMLEYDGTTARWRVVSRNF